MAKYSFELKLQAVLAYLEGKESFQQIAKRFNVSRTPLQNWVNHYKENGERGLTSSYTNYDIGSSTLIWTEKLRSRTLDLKQMRSSKYVKTRTPHIHDRVQKANGAAVPKWENETSNY